MNPVNVLAVTLSASILLNGCASIVSSSNRPLSVTSTPSGVPFVIKNAKGVELHNGTTPSIVTLKAGKAYFRKNNYSVVFKPVNAGETTQAVNAHLNGWYVGNLVFGGLIGFLIVDPLTGAMWRLPSTVNTTLAQPSTPLPIPAPVDNAIISATAP